MNFELCVLEGKWSEENCVETLNATVCDEEISNLVNNETI